MTAIPVHTRNEKTSRYGTYHSWWLPDAPADAEAWGLNFRNTGAISSISHRRSPDGKYREGGPFFSLKFDTKIVQSEDLVVFRKDNYKAYSGRFGAGLEASGYLFDFSYMSMHGLSTANVVFNADKYASAARWLIRPDRPDFSPVVSLAELHSTNLERIHEDFKIFNNRYHRELRRKARQGQFLNKQGRRHLAIQFGIKPILNDVIAFYQAFVDADKRFAQILRDNGKWVRRRARLETIGDDADQPPVLNWTDTRSEPWIDGTVPNLKAECYVEGAHATIQNESRKRIEVWAVGKTKYWIPGYEQKNRYGKEMKKMKRRIYGDFDINFDSIYNLIPWSWLLDYFLDFGSFFRGLSGGLSEGNIVYEYCYIMRHETHVDSTHCTSWVYKSPTAGGSVTYTINRVGVLKSRIAASLFGFGFTEEDLSPSQWAILGALGLSKL